MSQLFGLNTWSLEKLTPPWESAASIYLHVRDNPGDDLPDEPRDPSRVRFAPGAFDGVMGHHVGGSETEDAPDPIQKLEEALQQLLKKSTDENLKQLYSTVVAQRMLPIADNLQERIAAGLEEADVPRVAAVGRYFATGADHREATKFGILLLGVAGSRGDGRLLETLAGNDEFTLFAAVCLSRLVDDPEQSMWRVAQKVHGWGRVHLVERLNGSTNPEIQGWMLREGFSNSIMDNYLAAICARTGNLHEALLPPVIDAPLLEGARGILDALLDGGPSENIHDYEHAAEVIEAYLRHVAKTSGAGLKHLNTVSSIQRFLASESGWDQPVRDALRAQCEAIIQQKNWTLRIEEGLRSDDEEIFRTADLAARERGQDTWEFYLERVRHNPLRGPWFGLMQQANEARIDQVLELALSTLPLDKIATGPDTHMGLGPGFEAHSILDYILQDLPKFPGRGWPLIRAGLQSSVVRNRNMALRALVAWPREQWPADAYSLLQTASKLEPNEETKKRMVEALKVN